MTTTPLTDQQLADIQARHQAATSGTWYLQPNHGPDFVATEISGYERGIGSMDFGVGDQADADREFVLNAHADQAALLVELGRVRAELATARQQLDTLALVRVWRNEDGNEFLFADEVRAATGVPAAPTPGDGWVICSPEWLAAGGDCHNGPRRPSADPDYSHEHPAALSA